MVYGMAWWTWNAIRNGLAVIPWYSLGAWRGIWHGLAGIALNMVWWPGKHDMVCGMAWRAWHGYMIKPDGHGMLYGMTWRACHGLWYGLACMPWYIVWPGGQAGYTVRHSGYGIWYGLVCMAWYMVWPGGHSMVYGICMAGIAWSMVWPDRHGMVYDMVYGMALQASYDVRFGLASMLWYMVWPGWHRMAFGMTWRASHGI